MNLTNELNLPEPLVDAVRSNHAYKEHRYSVTEVLGGTCEAILKRRHDREITEDVSQRIWALFGTAVHEVLRRSKGTDTQLQENWMSVPVLDTGYELSGIFDLYDDATREVVDYKTGGTIKWVKQELDDYRRQVLIYCWMLRKLGFEANRGTIIMFLRDWSKLKANHEKDYPQHQVQRATWEFGKEDLTDASAHVLSWFTDVMEQEHLPDDQLTPCSPEQRWHKDDKWAIKKKGRKSAIRVLGSEEEAKAYAEQHGIDLESPTYSVEYRPGEDTKCKEYCPVKGFCPYYQALMKPREEPEG